VKHTFTFVQDPVLQLNILARRQSEVLASKLGTDESGREIPTRPLPYGSEDVRSPTYIAPVPPSRKTSTTGTNTMIQEPSYTGPSAAWEKGEMFPTQETPLGASEEEKDALEN
jgi:glycogenin glucosyltransferase